MADLVRERVDFAVATVVRTVGSTPQVVGAKLIVTAADKTRADGTLGGGCVEADAILAAREVLAHGGRSLRAYQLTEDLAWNTGLVCGGTMWILAERGDDALGDASLAGRLAEASSGGAPIAIATRLRREAHSLVFDGRVFVEAADRMWSSLGDAATDARAAELARDQLRHGTARVVPLDDEHDLLIEPVTSRPRLVVAGGGHVAAAIARQARLLDFDVTVLEDRPEFARAERFGDGVTVVAGDVPSAIATIDYGWNGYLVIATRGHKLDADCVVAAARTNARYIGLLGSRRKTVLIAERLREEGIPADRLDAIHAPVGLDLGGRTPAEIALSVLAEMTAVRYRAGGLPLRRGRP
jgi:xanthine dehydrogenase accessory factor